MINFEDERQNKERRLTNQLKRKQTFDIQDPKVKYAKEAMGNALKSR